MTEEEAHAIHLKVVEAGLFDRIPHADYAIGDIVAVRANETAHRIREIHNDLFVVDDGRGRDGLREVARNDIRPGNGYIQVIGQIVAPTAEMHMDRHGHGVTIHRLR